MSWTEFHPLVQEALRTTLAVGLLVTLVLIIRKPFSRRFGAKAGYMLWALPMVRFVMPPLPGNWSLSGALGWGQTTAANAPAAASTDPITLNFAPGAAETVTLAEAMPPVAPLELFSNSPETAASGTSLLEAILVQTPLILTCVWVAGMVLWLGRSIYQQRQFLQLIEHDSEPADAETVAETVRIARQLGLKKVPAIRASLLCSGPLVTGLKTPVVLLPMWFEEDYTIGERRDAIIHELMHLKRRDLWAFQAARIVAATQWFNPLVHLGLKAFRTDQEAACDADVINRAKLSPAAYGRTLVKAARLARPSDRRIAAASLTLAHPIKERLIMMTHPTPSLRSRLLGGTLAVALGAGAVFATASSVAQELDGGEKGRLEQTTSVEQDGATTFKIIVDGESYEFSTPDLPPMPPVPAFPSMPGLNMDADGTHFSLSIDTDKMEEFENSPEFAAWESKMEAWGEEMEAWGEMVEADAEKWSAAIEPQIEAWADKHAVTIEANAEAWAEQIEMMVEQQVERAEQFERFSGEKSVTKSETRDFGGKDFDQIELGSGFSMVYSQDPNASISATLERGNWDQVDIKVQDGTLKVKKKGGSRWNMSKGPRLTVYASSNGLNSIDIASGASFKGNVISKDLRVDASSGSSLSIEGACDSLRVDASSGSSLSLGNLECKSANVDASSGSSIRVYASESVDVDASSGSSIRVFGKPDTVKKDTSSGASVSIR
jgi:beta-lactamase regulating signal transducer with metallopeptidase domain